MGLGDTSSSSSRHHPLASAGAIEVLFLEGSKLLTGDDSCQIGSNHLEFSKVLGHRALAGYVVNSITKTLVLGVAIVYAVVDP